MSDLYNGQIITYVKAMDRGEGRQGQIVAMAPAKLLVFPFTLKVHM